MSTIVNRTEEQESAMIMSAVRRYFGEDFQIRDQSGSDSSLLEALKAYFRERKET